MPSRSIPKNWSPYCRSPKLPTKSAQSSAVQSVMIASGKVSPMPWLPYVVGVCSLEERPSESSESLARTGELLCTLLSYSSSASDSGYAVPDSNAIIIFRRLSKR